MPITLTPNSSGSTWYYAAQQDVQDLIGTDNETVSFDEDNDGNLNADQVLRAGEWSDAYINMKLRNAGLTAPNPLTDTSVAAVLKSASAHLAAWVGFHQRGLRDYNPAQPQTGIAGVISGYKKLADEMLDTVIGVLALENPDDAAEEPGGFGFSTIVRGCQSITDENSN